MSDKHRTIQTFDRIAPFYDRFLFFMPKVHQQTLQNLPAGALRMLDVCTGTGELALRAARQRAGLEVTGLDLSPGMLSRARAKGVSLPNCHFILGDATALPFPPDSFDVVTCSLGLHELPAQAQQPALDEIFRVTRPGGTVLITDYSHRVGQPGRAILSLCQRFEDLEPFYQLGLQGQLARRFREGRVLPILWGVLSIYLGREKLA